MTDPTPMRAVDADDATETDELVEPTGNALQPDDPLEQPSQQPDDLPDGTETDQR